MSPVPLLQVGDRAVQSVGNATHLSLPPGTTGLQIACWCAPQSRSRLSRSVDATLCGAFHVCRLKGLNPATGPRLLREGGGLSVTLPAGCAPQSTSAPGPGSPVPHRHRDRACRHHICTGTGQARCVAASGWYCAADPIVLLANLLVPFNSWLTIEAQGRTFITTG